MKSFLIAAPIVGLVAAKHSHPKPCSSQSTVYEFTTSTYTVTVPASSSISTPVTSLAPAKSTKYLTSVIYVTPSPAPYYPLPNGTYNGTHPSTGAPISYVLPSSSTEESSAAPAETSPPTESSYAAAPSSEAPAAASTSSAYAPIPTSKSAATPAASTSPNVGTDAAIGGSNAGEATFYGGNTDGGMCSFTGYTLPSGIYGTALSDSNWASAGNCGACVSVTGPSGNSIKAMITDQCPGCGTNHLDLYPDAFAALADPSKGVINIKWSIVPCGITSPIILKNKSGTSPYWFSMQVVNANVPVSKLEVSTDSGATWKATTRQPYNYFENASGFGTSSVDVRVTSVHGGTVVVKGVSVSSGVTATAASNLS
ncbi:RlpA-like double-psi beta-barrel-protein domain-containing protein-containing protein [Lophiotrema nucula]|uniref:RlpA-like double-psi beta-barrel-protein domain-containing protein-containing protein n=1 Tax=Lophiotrema nucula TaxID=690887 RepID=A0A6A5Z6R6_9PLEO|nr:RlpA-like double-psi beta-barrel-protein domain-containing protein-containing protein [Lophiotrema nucula]